MHDEKKVFYALVLSLLLIPSLVLGADTLPKALDYIVSMQEPERRVVTTQRRISSGDGANELGGQGACHEWDGERKG